jgi:hypothetical protein
MGRLASYISDRFLFGTTRRRLQDQNRELQQRIDAMRKDIYTLIDKPGSPDAMIILGRYEWERMTEEAVWYGTPLKMERT